MNTEKYRLKTEEANEIPLRDLLGTLGFYHVETKKAGSELWYKSPFRPDEERAKFVVNVKTNKWFDFKKRETGDKKGSVLEFIKMYKNCGISEAFKFLLSLKIVPCNKELEVDKKDSRNVNYSIHTISKICDRQYLQYLESRGVNTDIAGNYLVQLKYFKHDGQKIPNYGIAMENDAGGFELRGLGDDKFKDKVLNTGITTIDKSKNTVSVFEGFLDFLALLTMKDISSLSNDAIILHTTNNVRLAINKIKAKQYKKVFSFLDRDDEGNKATEQLINGLPIEVKDMRYLYEGFNDINDQLLNKPQVTAETN